MRHFTRYILFLLLFLCLLAPQVQAADYHNAYLVEYFLSESSNQIVSHVKFTVTITNQRSDLYVKRFGLAFPKSFAIQHLTAADNSGSITPEVATDDKKTKVDMEFSDPAIGKGTRNTFVLEFDQDNLFKVNGNVWEVILPVIDTQPGDDYRVIVNLPQDSQQKISISKPKPDDIQGKKIIWNNPQSKTIYAVFGQKQYYEMRLSYHLVNDRLSSVYTDVAFPPDTLYQKIYVNSIVPTPALVYLDADNNYLGRYILKSKQKLEVQFDGISELSVAPRADIKAAVIEQLAQQRQYLKQTNGYWKITDINAYAHLSQPDQIYTYIRDTFKYNYQRVNKNVARLGAQKALDNPDQVVCVEFADAFVALSRRKGILARELEGYGFSNDPQLRPLSLISDVLHAWPEFYDKDAEVWRPVDPTWENTSGIDYYNSFDLNHIVFAIHGKQDDYPYPAGVYKIDNSKDISVTATDAHPQENQQISARLIDLPIRLTGKRSYNARLRLINQGNTFVWSLPISVTAQNLTSSLTTTTLTEIAPLEARDIPITLTIPNVAKRATGTLEILIANQHITQKVDIMPFYYDVAIKVTFVVLVILTLIVLLQLVRLLFHRRPSGR